VSRILEINPSQEETVVSRVLLLVHQAIDEKFPDLQNAPRQFTKTVFSDEGESTAQHYLPAEARGSDGAPHDVPPPPPVENRRGAKSQNSSKAASQEAVDTRPSPHNLPSKADPTAPRSSMIAKNDQRTDGESFSNSTRLGTEMESLKPEPGLSDWGTRITVALLLAGIVLFVYAILA
jgi:hypothetical protein